MKILSLGVTHLFFVILILVTASETSAATCGGGDRGDGLCPNGGCCSEWGWCVKDTESWDNNSSDMSSDLPSLAPTTRNGERMMHVRKMKLQMTVTTSRRGAIDTSELSDILTIHLRVLLQQNLQQMISDDINYETVDVMIAAVTIVGDKPIRLLSRIAKEPHVTHVRILGRVILPGNTPILFLNKVDSMIRSAFDGEKEDQFLDRLHDAEDSTLRSSVQVWRGFSDNHNQKSPSPSLESKPKKTSSVDYSSSTPEYDQKKLPLDYSMFGIVVLTLSLLLVVEALRHRLDVMASGNEFFETVLELMYRELTTLGVVEFILYLMHRYHPNFNYSLEAVFIDVHFMLCYTAIFNAIQSVLLRLITSRRAEKAWVQTENVEISHYVAIRKEFDRVENELKRLRHKHKERISIDNGEMHEGRVPTRTRFPNWTERIQHPDLTRRKYKLLVPIRFHELRVHLIAQNNLPPKFKVSSYLKSSLTSTLVEFVHISSYAWIMLMITVSLIYFVSGLILYFSKSQSTLPEFLVGAFIAIMALCWILALLLFFKMKDIFEHILTMHLPIDRKQEQISLFWGGNPRFVIILTQYMQFGFALGLAACVTYWKELYSASFGHTNTAWALPVVVVSYILFQPLLADILEWYTLCTNMGQLVSTDRLLKALAEHKLDEEIRKQKSLQDEKKLEDAISKNLKAVEEFDCTSDNNIRVSELSLSKLVQVATEDLPEMKLPESSNNDLVRFFDSYTYQTLSFLIGPMVCFFMVGRVEGFVITSGVISDDLNTFQLSLSTSFWLETACYGWIFVELYITLAVYIKSDNVQGVAAATFGIMINIICLSLLMISEMMRCCSNNRNGILNHTTFGEQDDHCCSNFGERTYGGLGLIEPFTSLIVLSPLRYLVAGIMFRVRCESHDHLSNDKIYTHHGPDPLGKARPLWYATISTHSGIAEKYGMFSTQILYAMLGIDMPGQELLDVCIDRDSHIEYSRFTTETSMQCQYSICTVANSTHGSGASLAQDNSTKDSPLMTFENVYFDYPAARLVLDVCRCECRLLPLLEEWILVDVILTSHELVIFGVLSGDCGSGNAVEVLHGSRGLCLSDIAKGRSVLSQFSLDNIDHLNIEHMLATPGGEMLSCYESFPGGLVSNDALDLEERWMASNESRLKIHFTNGCGTLFLRFLADLNEMECFREDSSLKSNSHDWLLSSVGSQVKLWCQTIARLQGEQTSREPFSDVELKDFIQITKRGDVRRRDSSHGRMGHRRTSMSSTFSILKGQMG